MKNYKKQGAFFLQICPFFCSIGNRATALKLTGNASLYSLLRLCSKPVTFQLHFKAFGPCYKTLFLLKMSNKPDKIGNKC